MSAAWLKPGARCRTKPQLLSPEGLGVSPLRLENRKPRQSGLLLSPVAGHDGAVWLMQHGPQNRVAAYWAEELAHLAPVREPEQWALFE